MCWEYQRDRFLYLIVNRLNKDDSKGGGIMTGITAMVVSIFHSGTRLDLSVS
jgi:hypothetical protein